jgi:molybdenum cofactor cytidylyltransferase
MINAIIMASGNGNRMGTNKLLLKYQGKALIQHIIDKVVKCDFYSTILVSQYEQVLSLARESGMEVVHNYNPERGQSESIKLGILNSPKADGYMFFTGDQPLMDVKTIKLLMDSFKESVDLIIVPKCGEKRGNPVIFPRKFMDELLNLQGDNGGRSIIDKHLKELKFLEITNECLLSDIDTEEQYKELLNMKAYTLY